MDFQNLLHTFVAAIGNWFGGAIAIIILGIGSLFLLRYLAKNKGDAQILTMVLTVSRTLLAQRLGDRGTDVFNALIAGLDKVKDGDFTQEEMAQELIEFVRVAVKGKFELNEQEVKALTDVVMTIMQFFAERKKAAPKVVTSMMLSIKE